MLLFQSEITPQSSQLWHLSTITLRSTPISDSNRIFVSVTFNVFPTQSSLSLKRFQEITRCINENESPPTSIRTAASDDSNPDYIKKPTHRRRIRNLYY